MELNLQDLKQSLQYKLESFSDFQHEMEETRIIKEKKEARLAQEIEILKKQVNTLENSISTKIEYYGKILPNNCFVIIKIVEKKFREPDGEGDGGYNVIRAKCHENVLFFGFEIDKHLVVDFYTNLTGNDAYGIAVISKKEILELILNNPNVTENIITNINQLRDIKIN